MAVHTGNRGMAHGSRTRGAFTPLVISTPSPAVGQLVLNKAAKTGFTYLYGTM